MENTLEFLCTDFDVKEVLDDVPKLSITINISNKCDCSLYIPQINFDITLLSVPPKSYTSSYKIIGWLDTLASKPIFIGKKDKKIELYLPINTPRLERMLDIRQQDCLIGFLICATGLYFHCSTVENVSNRFMFERPENIRETVRYNLPHGPIDQIVIMSEQFIKIIEKLKHYELIRLEIPVKKPATPAQNNLNEALQFLQSAKNELIQNNYVNAMLCIRNILLNNLMENKPNSSEKVLKEDIRHFIISNTPSDAQEAYKDIIDYLDKTLRQISNILSKFIHEGSDKLKQTPLRQDVELCYYLTLFILRRLSYQIT